MKPHCCKLTACVLAGVLSATSSGFAQTSAEPTPPKEEIIELNPFVVSSATDKGWIATRSASATKTNTPLTELSQRVTVFNADFLHDSGADSVLDAIRFVGNGSGADRRTDNQGVPVGLKLRGFNATTRVDGYVQSTGFFRTDTAGIERIEFLRGASAVLFGSTSPGGAVNLITKVPSLRASRSVEVSVGDFDYYKASVDLTGPLAFAEGWKLAYRTVVAYKDAGGPRNYEEERSWFLQQSLSLRLGKIALLGRVEYQKIDGRESIARPYGVADAIAPGGFRIFTEEEIPFTFFRGEPNDYKDASVLRGTLNAQTELGTNWVANLSLRAAQTKTLRHETFVDGPAAGVAPNLRTRDSQDVRNPGKSANFDLDLLGNLATGPIKHQLLVGYSWNAGWGTNFITNRRLVGGPLGGGQFDLFNPAYGGYDFGPVRANSNFVTASKAYGVYLQDQIKMFDDRLISVVGVRRDYSYARSTNRNAGTTTTTQLWKTSPRYSLLFKASERWSAYAAVNDAFQGRPNGIKSGTVNTPLDPQESRQLEAGVKFVTADSRLYADIAVFEIKQKNLAVPDIRFPGTPFQLQSGEVTSDGWELELGWNVTPNWQIYGGFGTADIRTTQDSVATNLGKHPASSPEASGGLFTKYRFRSGPLNGFTIGGGATHMGTFAGDVANSFFLPSATVFNALVRYEWKSFALSLNVENLFDKSYTAGAESVSFAIPGDPRWIKLSFTGKF